MRFVALEKLINLHDGYRRRFKIDQLDILILQEQGKLAIVQSRCPHRQFPLTDAEVVDNVIVCPVHGYGFDLSSGRSLEPSCPGLAVWPVVYEGNAIGIMLSDSSLTRENS